MPIIAVPESGWKVKRITINNQIVEFTTSDDGSVTLPQFTEMSKINILQFGLLIQQMNIIMR